MKTFLLSLLLVLPIAASAQKVWEGCDYTVTKISNPDRGEREVDGLVAGGDRQNSYTWRMAMRGDEIYIATARNIASALVNLYGESICGASGMSMDAFWTMIDAVTNGDIMRNDANEGANIICYNRKTGRFKVVWTGEDAEYQRMAVTFDGNVYFGSYSADPSVVQYILKLDQEGNFTKVFETTGCTAMRANCVYDDHLFFASADDRTVVAEGDEEPISKMAVIRKSNDDDTEWERVADYRDFGDIPYDPIHSSWAGAPFWELASHNGYIYATAPSMAGFVIFKGRPAQDGESANDYGWHWEEVAGLNNGINNPGLSKTRGGQPGTMRSLIGSVFEFNGELYAYDFDHAFGGEAQAFVGMLQRLNGADVKACDYLSYMYNSLRNPQRVWKLDDATGKFNECKEFTKLMEGTTNEYIWRMGQYDGQLYIATMDAGIFYNYMTQLTNGSFFKMSLEEKRTKVQYISNVLKILATSKALEKVEEIKESLAQLKDFLEQFVEEEQVDEETVRKYINYQRMAATIAIGAGIEIALVKAKIDAMPGEDIESKVLLAALEKVQEVASDIAEKIDLKGAEMYLYINHAVMTNKWGFDLIRTADGENFEVITRTGFDDKYNYGCSSFLATEEGLYFGTCNPFYGGQLFLLTSNAKEDPDDVSSMSPTTDPTAISSVGANSDANIYYDLSGRRLQGKPVMKGVYIKNGKKVVY